MLLMLMRKRGAIGDANVGDHVAVDGAADVNADADDEDGAVMLILVGM